MDIHMYSIKTCVFFIFIALSTSNINGTYHHGHQTPNFLASHPSVGAVITTSYSDSINNSMVVNVVQYGAKGDGKTDDSKAFQSAWSAACMGQSSIMIIPSGLTFLLYPIIFLGKDCKTTITFQLDGKIIAPADPKAQGIKEWISFRNINGMIIQGNGVIDGQGSSQGKIYPIHNPMNEIELRSSLDEDSDANNSIDNKDTENQGNLKPTAITFFQSTNVNVTGITIQNSAKFHLTFHSSSTIHVFDMRISSAGDSHNTDGIHLQNAQDVTIYRTNISCGDDCISIQTGSSNIHINNVNCGPGHGISIGGLKMDSSVHDVEVRDSIIHDTSHGLRIKSWQGASGSVQRVTYSNVQVFAVKYPIAIDQYYCDQAGQCPNKTSAVAISDINYMNIKGTYINEPVHLACSDSVPCRNLTFAEIGLTPVKKIAAPFCWNAIGEVRTRIVPPINCLQKPRQNRKVLPIV